METVVRWNPTRFVLECSGSIDAALQFSPVPPPRGFVRWCPAPRELSELPFLPHLVPRGLCSPRSPCRLLALRVISPDGKLAQIARHAVGGGKVMAKQVADAHRQQVPDSDLFRRRNRSRPAGARCRAERHRRDG